MQVSNNTPFKAMANPGFDKDGREVVSVIIKGTFGLSDRGRAEALESSKQVEIVMADEYWGAPGESPVKAESDLAPFKPGTDLILVGNACGRNGQATRHFSVDFTVGGKSKKGHFFSLSKQDQLPLHLLDWQLKEDKWKRRKKPTEGFGYFPKQAPPRVNFAGTYDSDWQENRSPFLPEDFDYRFFQAAFPDLICYPHLRGDEVVEIGGVFPDGRLLTALPAVTIEIEGFIRNERVKALPNLDTIVFDSPRRWVVLVWRAVFKTGGTPADVKGFVTKLVSLGQANRAAAS
jgi:hypothetical protein